MHPLMEQHRSKIKEFARNRGLENVRVFGSMARGDANALSGIDLLVVLPQGRSGLALAGLMLDVEALTHRKVDVVTPGALHPSLRDAVLLEAETL